ncbi:MAG: Ig-like domain-containing protein, partial [Acetobacter syzygii]
RVCEARVAHPKLTKSLTLAAARAPEHGKAFLYSLDNDTHVTYTPTQGYAGQDKFTVILIPGPGQQRTRLTVTAQVDATGVFIPHPAVTAPTPAAPAKKAVTKRATRAAKNSKN